MLISVVSSADFYPRSPCGERPPLHDKDLNPDGISIHALLAESDNFRCSIKCAICNFYPRSPCGERPNAVKKNTSFHKLFLSTLSLRRATNGIRLIVHIGRFLSTLSLRRATRRHSGDDRSPIHFYPRSPCGERPAAGRLSVILII